MTHLVNLIKRKYNQQGCIIEPWDMLFKDIFDRESFFQPILSTRSSYPVDIYEDENHMYIEIAAVGVDKDDIDIEEEDNILTVSYTKPGKEESESNTPTNYIVRGLAKRAFSLSWKFSDKFNLSKIDASLEKGILKLQIPKHKEKPINKNKINIG